MAVRDMVESGTTFAKLCQDRSLVLSQKKSCILSKHGAAAEEVRAGLYRRSRQCYTIAKAVKNIGLDMNGGGRRSRATARRGFSAAAKRVARARKLGSARKIAGQIFRTAAWQQASYTAKVDGMAPTELAKVRRLCRASCQAGTEPRLLAPVLGVACCHST